MKCVSFGGGDLAAERTKPEKAPLVVLVPAYFIVMLCVVLHVACFVRRISLVLATKRRRSYYVVRIFHVLLNAL